MDNFLLNKPARTKKPLAVAILFAIEVAILLILLATSQYMSGLELGIVIFMPILLLAYIAILALLIAIPILSIVALTDRMSLSSSQKVIVWVALVINALGLLAIVFGLVQLFVSSS